ncbi:hypothetical protein [Deinococcus ruber]|uniref:Uncharacterized protein n=1 Tax=Deinococcus ruber TaxID=1848197 RepID=A0A918BXA3_9DEIO|nr:hypothetical protein [Deinococcus ruber]GGQ95500.1 hypothetical protein GCM10008957_04970 [Deinococcus ruber]
MDWYNVSRRRGTHQRLQSHGHDLRPVTEHTFTFIFSDGQLPDETRHPFYTAIADTASAAEEAAYTVYLRAQGCTHQFRRSTPSLLTCGLCSIHLRSQETPPTTRSPGMFDRLQRVFRRPG